MKILLPIFKYPFQIICYAIGALVLNLALSNIAFANTANNPNILEKKIDVEYQSMTIVAVLDDIEERTGISFIYAENLIDSDKKVMIHATGRSVKDILDEIFISVQIEYIIEGNQVVLKKKNRDLENGIIVGSVVAEGNREVLPFASIQLKGTFRGVVCDNEGKFRLSSLYPGRYTLVASFVGYEKIEQEVAVTEKGTTEVIIELPNLYKEMEGVTVTGIRKGEIKALTKMKNSENIKYILSQEQMERFPDLTVGESLQRVPGVAVGYSYGIPNQVIIRGLDQSMSSVQINGNRIPSTTTGGRATDLNGILSNTIESIEVVKTLTPDQDADGTGGTVNIVTKQATASQPIFDARASVGYNHLVNKGNYELGATYGQKPGKLGYLISANYLRSNRGQERIQKEYDEYELPDGSSFYGLSDFRLSSHDLRRDNLGVTADLHYDASERYQFYLRSSYNYYYELQFGPELRYGIDAYSQDNVASEVSISKERNWRDYNRSVFSVSGGGTVKLPVYEIKYDGTFSKGIYDQPIYFGSGFSRNETELVGLVDVSDREAPVITFPEEADVLNPNDFSTNRYINRHDQAEDRDIQLKLDVSRPIEIADHSGTFKFGGKYRHKYNDRSRNYFLHDLKEGEFVLADYLDPYSNNDFFDKDYSFEHFPDAEKLDDFYHNNPDLFVDNETYTRQNTDPDSFEGNEYLFAAYLMSSMNFGPLEVVAGVRFEQTGFDYTGNSVTFDNDGDYVSTNPIDSDGSFADVFPSLNLKYALSKNTNFRAAVTRSLVRPDYYDMVPWEEVLYKNESVGRGNPDLTQATSVNLDGLFEHYFQSVGLLSGGVFHKKVKNYLYETTFTEVGGQFDGYRVEQVLNGADATVYGFELAWQQQLTFLPGFLNGLGIYLNYTYVQSEFKVPGEETEREVALPEMRPHVGNVSLSYEKYGFSGRISAYFYDSYILSLSENPAEDEYERERLQLDFSASQKITPRLSIYTGISNLSNAPSGDYFGNKSRPYTDYKYSWWGNVGFRYSLL